MVIILKQGRSKAVAREAVAWGARFKGAHKNQFKLKNYKFNGIKDFKPQLLLPKKAFWAQHLFKFNSFGNLFTVNYSLAFHNINKEFFQFFVKPTKK